MRRILSLTLTLLISTLGFSQLTVEKIMEDPAKWIGTSPSGVSWSDDSKTIYFNWNPEQNMGDSLFKVTLDDLNPKKVSLEEKRANNLGRSGFNPFMGGFSSPSFSKDDNFKLYVDNGDIFIKDLRSDNIRQLTSTLERKSGVKFSADETKVIYNAGNNVFTIDLADGKLTQLTNFTSGNARGGFGGMSGRGMGGEQGGKKTDADKTLEQDQLDLFMVLREAKERKEATEAYNKSTKDDSNTLREISIGGKNLQGVVASPDLKYVFYNLSTPSTDGKRTIVPNYVTASGYTVDIPSRTKVGQPMGSSEAYIYSVASQKSVKISTNDIPGIEEHPKFWADYPDKEAPEGPREVTFQSPIFSPNGNHVVVVLRAQDNKDRWIMKLDGETGKLSLIDRQRDEAWIGGPGVSGWGNSTSIGFIDENTFYYQSEATGYSHLYTYDFNTGKTTQLTSGNFEIQRVQLSKDKQWFYMTTNEVHPGENHFYKMSVKGGERIQLTKMTGGNNVTLSPDEKTLAILYSNTNTPWELYIQDNEPNATARKVTSSLTNDFKAYPWREAEIITFKARDGKDIYARIYQPKRKKNGKAVVFVHGAGYLQNAHKWWSSYFREYMFHNLLVDKGYTVLDIDYRASAGYGRDVRTGIYRHMGGLDLTDQVDGAKLLVDKYKINPKKIGIYGGSYGGFITLMAMFTTPDVFAAGAALRPVTDWAAYNQGYTANILNNPQDDPIAYRNSSPIFFAEGLTGNLLICHGQVDVNVHIQDTYRLAQRLIELRKENWEVASYPVEDHGFVEPTSWMDEYKRILKIFEEM